MAESIPPGSPRASDMPREPPQGSHLMRQSSQGYSEPIQVKYITRTPSMKENDGIGDRPLPPQPPFTSIDTENPRYRDSKGGDGKLKKTMRPEEPREKSKSKGIGLRRRFKENLGGVHVNEEYGDEGHYQMPGQYYSYDQPNSRDLRDRDQRSMGESGLRREHERLIQENAQLKELLRAEQEKVGRFAATTDRMQRTMDSQELFLGGQAADAEVLARFQAWTGQVRTWTSRLDGGRPLEKERLAPEAIEAFELVAPGSLSKDAEFWKSGKRTRALLRGWLGFVIADTIFRSRTGEIKQHNAGRDHWMGEKVANAVNTLEDKLATADKKQVSLGNLNDWRALTIELLARIDLGAIARQEAQKSVEDTARDIMRVMKDFMPEGAVLEKKKSLIDLLASSISFSQFLRRQRACWWVVGPLRKGVIEHTNQHPQMREPFNPIWMKDDDQIDDDASVNENKLVELFLSPGLIKRGNIDGENYDQQDCVVKILTSCLSSKGLTGI